MLPVTEFRNWKFQLTLQQNYLFSLSGCKYGINWVSEENVSPLNLKDTFDCKDTFVLINVWDPLTKTEYRFCIKPKQGYTPLTQGLWPILWMLKDNLPVFYFSCNILLQTLNTNPSNWISSTTHHQFYQIYARSTTWKKRLIPRTQKKKYVQYNASQLLPFSLYNSIIFISNIFVQSSNLKS